MMFKILLIFTTVITASHGHPPPNNPRNTFSSTYILYTNAQPKIGQPIQLNVDSVKALNITARTNCAMIVHGINDRGIGPMSTVLRDALLTSGTINIIIVDWSGGAIDEWATDFIEQVTNDAVKLIRLLSINTKASPATLHLIGFDMGAHIVGLIGRTSTYTIARITGLNPAKTLENAFNSLRRTDANYVEVIHTETTTAGISNAAGDVDFYPQGGKNQPGCAENDAMCSHNRAWELFAASLTHGDIIGNRCPTFAKATSDKPCTGFTLALGTNLVKYGSGLYRFETNPVYPYRCLVKCGLIDSIIKAIENIIGEDDPETDTTDTTVMTTGTTDATTDTTDDTTDVTDATAYTTNDTTDTTDDTTDVTNDTTYTTDDTTDITNDTTDTPDDTTDVTDDTTDTTVMTTVITDATTDTTNDTTDITDGTTYTTDDITDITDDTTDTTDDTTDTTDHTTVIN